MSIINIIPAKQVEKLMGSNLKPYVEGEGIGEVYFKALNTLLKKKSFQHFVVQISKPIMEVSVKPPRSLNIDDWKDIINLGSIYQNFCRYPFSDGNSGKYWINNRIEALLMPGRTYYQRLEKPLNMVKERLCARNKKGDKMHGSCTNALVCNVFRLEDLKRACIPPRPNAKGLPCVSMIDFKPKFDKLSLYSVFRSQYFDIKAYGNFISLAILLYQVCRETGYLPGSLISTANNVTFYDSWAHAKNLYDFLQNPEKSIKII